MAEDVIFGLAISIIVILAVLGLVHIGDSVKGYEMHSELIERGLMEYNSQTGEIQWVPPSIYTDRLLTDDEQKKIYEAGRKVNQ